MPPPETAYTYASLFDSVKRDKKCTVIGIYNQRHTLQRTYTLHGHYLEVFVSGKYLGVTISLDLQWNKTHLQHHQKNNQYKQSEQQSLQQLLSPCSITDWWWVASHVFTCRRIGTMTCMSSLSYGHTPPFLQMHDFFSFFIACWKKD